MKLVIKTMKIVASALVVASMLVLFCAYALVAMAWLVITEIVNKFLGR